MKFIDLEIENYCILKSNVPSSDCTAIEKFTKENVHGAQMLIGQMEASFLGFLINANQVKDILELGTFTGYSALAMAEQLPNDGSLITIDIDPKTNLIAREYWDKSIHGKKINNLLGSALDLLPEINKKFDLIFIDADKKNYLEYLKLSLSKLNLHGIIVVDNVLWSGKVLENSKLENNHYDSNTEYIRNLNNFVAADKNLYGTLLPIRDGMFLITKIN